MEAPPPVTSNLPPTPATIGFLSAQVKHYQALAQHWQQAYAQAYADIYDLAGQIQILSNHIKAMDTATGSNMQKVCIIFHKTPEHTDTEVESQFVFPGESENTTSYARGREAGLKR
ncbi:hypothetical protein PG990_001610 [Apiospora arundinis]|uniref:Uncharacterized protein n=1 Tax=Apiospora arundinis TaxID=335852 RepID=A0ABR2HRR4_9PEZI